MGRTRKDAQQQAAENALRSLAGKQQLFEPIPKLCSDYIVCIAFVPL